MSSWPQAKISSKLQVFMASSKDFLKAASLHGLKPKISFKLQVFMASSQDFLLASTIHDLKPRFLQN
jgi:hypothetical protein